MLFFFLTLYILSTADIRTSALPSHDWSQLSAGSDAVRFEGKVEKLLVPPSTHIKITDTIPQSPLVTLPLALFCFSYVRKLLFLEWEHTSECLPINSLVCIYVRVFAWFFYVSSSVLIMDQKLVCTILLLKVTNPRFFSTIPYNICDSMRESSGNLDQHVILRKEFLRIA